MLLKDLLQRAVKMLHRRLADYVGKEHQKGRRTCSTIIFSFLFFWHQKGCPTCSTIIFPHSTNQIIDLLRCRCRCPLPGCRCRKQSNARGLPGGGDVEVSIWSKHKWCIFWNIEATSTTKLNIFPRKLCRRIFFLSYYHYHCYYYYLKYH